jgi:hypothetical protein
MRLLAGDVLIGTARPHRYPPEAEATQQIADRSFGQLDPVALLDHMRQIDPAPAHHPMLGQIRSFANQLGHLSFLLRGESRFGSGSGSIVKALQTFRIVAVHPVAKNLQVHAAGFRCLAARLAFQHQRLGQHSACRISIICTLCLAPKLCRRVVQAGDGAAGILASSPNQEGKGITPTN